MAEVALPGVPFEMLAAQMRACKTKQEFQVAICYNILKRVIRDATQGVTFDNSAQPEKGGAYTYVSNHRDIVLDSGFLSMMLVEQGQDTVEIAIGDNLLIYPWIKKLVRINKSFIVQRALTMRQMLESSARMSRYMHHTIRDKHQSIWIAQREGRAKDSNDRTQESILKMMAMAGEGDIISRLKEMNIVPLAISYEYDPCDYLKAKEFQQKRDNPDHKKTTADDLLNMQTGILGYKGRVHFCTALLHRPLPQRAVGSLGPLAAQTGTFRPRCRAGGPRHFRQLPPLSQQLRGCRPAGRKQPLCLALHRGGQTTLHGLPDPTVGPHRPARQGRDLLAREAVADVCQPLAKPIEFVI